MIRKSTHSQVAHDCQPESGYFQQISPSCSKTKASQFFEIVMSRGSLLFAPFVFSVLLSLTVEVTSLRSSSDLWSLLNIMDCKQILSIFYGIMCGLVVVWSDCQAIHLFSPQPSYSLHPLWLRRLHWRSEQLWHWRGVLPRAQEVGTRSLRGHQTLFVKEKLYCCDWAWWKRGKGIPIIVNVLCI